MMSQSQSQSVFVEPELVVKLVKYILNNSFSKLGIKRPDIVSQVLGGNTKKFNAALEGAKEVLKDVYGVDVIEVPNKTPRQFICVSTMESTSKLEFTPGQQKVTALLFIVLSYIFMKGGSIEEDTLHNFLKKLGISMEENEPHGYFGSNIKKLLSDTLVKQLYLQRTKQVVEGTNVEIIEISWGFRSTLEFPKAAILEQVAQLLQKPATNFVRQYAEVHDLDDIEMDVV